MFLESNLSQKDQHTTRSFIRVVERAQAGGGLGRRGGRGRRGGYGRGGSSNNNNNNNTANNRWDIQSIQSSIHMNSSTIHLVKWQLLLILNCHPAAPSTSTQAAARAATARAEAAGGGRWPPSCGRWEDSDRHEPSYGSYEQKFSFYNKESY